MALHLFRLFNVEDVHIHARAQVAPWRSALCTCPVYANLTQVKSGCHAASNCRFRTQFQICRNSDMPLIVSHVLAECSLISGRIIIDVLSKVEAPPACHHPQLGLKNHMHVLGFRSIACTHPFLLGDQVYTCLHHRLFIACHKMIYRRCSCIFLFTHDL